jgi:NADH:ubiquinone oxidoreductase subunit F (NADH-binding)
LPVWRQVRRKAFFIYAPNIPLAVRRVREAISLCEQEGYLGDNILGSGHRFQVRIAQGAGAFVCGEETALIASLEGGAVRPYSDRPILRNGASTIAHVGEQYRNPGAGALDYA